jgi:hypothetical protein
MPRHPLALLRHISAADFRAEPFVSDAEMRQIAPNLADFSGNLATELVQSLLSEESLVLFCFGFCFVLFFCLVWFSF